MKKILAPTFCPSCEEVLEWEKELLYCRNPECRTQVAKKVENFAKVLKIKGLGAATIEKLRLSSIIEIYELTLDEVRETIGDKLAIKLIKEITNTAYNIPLQDLLPAFSIPLIGKTASNKLCSVLKGLSDLNEETCKEAGLGPKATENLVNWYKDTFVQEQLYNLPFHFQSDLQQDTKTKWIVCISGRLSSFKSKAEATQALLRNGYSTKDSVTSNVDYLINESGVESAKTKKARDLGIPIINNIQKLIGA
jgi:DNA ligase (NAD+)